MVALAFDDRAPAALDAHADEVAIARSAAGLMREKLGLPLPTDTKVYLYVNQATLAEGLVQDGGLKTEAAWYKARFAAGVASARGLFLRADVLVRMPLRDRVGLIAHELAHVSQFEMRRGGKGAAAHWIREGHADWVKFQVLEGLGIQPYAASREEVSRSVLRSSTPIKFFPNLVELARDDQWDEARNRLGSAATYGQAFLAVDWLVERYGIETLHAFFRLFALDDNPGTRWGRVYPIPFRQFVQEFRTRLETLGSQP